MKSARSFCQCLCCLGDVGGCGEFAFGVDDDGLLLAFGFCNLGERALQIFR